MSHRRYDVNGQYKYTARFHPRRQLERNVECRGIHVESEQYADEYQYEHWLSRRQELTPPPFFIKWPQEWWLITVITSVHEDLPFVLSKPASALPGRLNKRVGGKYSLYAIFCPWRVAAAY